MRFSHSMPMNQQSTTREDIKEDYNTERLSEEKSKEQGTMDNKNQQQSKVSSIHVYVCVTFDFVYAPLKYVVYHIHHQLIISSL
ncbi:unnamed protein product [Trichobilharzia regenti]|nr:unnamed protein product [Trichobilharzia regenti]